MQVLRNRAALGVSLTLLCLLAGTQPQAAVAGGTHVASDPAKGPELRVHELPAPVKQGLYPAWAGSVVGSAEPLAPALIWTERGAGRTYKIRTASLTGEVWGTPRTIKKGSNGFVNWADFPALAQGQDGVLFATWLSKLGKGTFAYGAESACCEDSSGSFEARGLLHEDDSPTEHGFVSLVADPDGGFHASWLDGRNTLEKAVGDAPADTDAAKEKTKGAMALYAGSFDAQGRRIAEWQLDERVCDCCQTDAVLTAAGTLVIAYRDRSPGEVRDIAVVHGRPGEEGSWSKPQLVHDDGWYMPGCPVNGPALACHGDRIALVWYTCGREQPARVLCAISDDQGASFSEPRQVDDGKPLGRVDACFTSDGLLVLSWLELSLGAAEWRARAWSTGLEAGDSVMVARVSGDRADGFLRMCSHGRDVLAAWTLGEDGTLGLARLSRP